MDSNSTWHWQERNTAWKGVGIYHVTLTIPSREPLLGTLVIPNNNPSQAAVERTPLGEGVIDCLMHLYEHYPEVRILQFCLMPDHLHVILHVRQTMPRGIMSVVRGYWQAVKKLGRAYTASLESASVTSSSSPQGLTSSLSPQGLTSSLSPHGLTSSLPPDTIRPMTSSFSPNTIRGKEPSHPLFTEMPFVRPLVHHGQLHSMMRYVQMNPQRLATKRLMPGFFRVQEDIEIAGRRYSGVGNIALLQSERFAPVHVRRTMVDEAEHGDDRRLRDYMNGCVIAARQGTVMVSPFIFPKEKDVLDVLLKEQHPFILLADNGFRDYYKPSDALFDAVAAGRVLILSPWDYDPDKRHISRADCVALNAMAEDICGLKS